MEENDQNLWDIMNDTIVVILADENNNVCSFVSLRIFVEPVLREMFTCQGIRGKFFMLLSAV